MTVIHQSRLVQIKTTLIGFLTCLLFSPLIKLNATSEPSPTSHISAEIESLAESEKAAFLLDLGDQIRKTDPATAIAHFDNAIALAQAASDKTIESTAENSKAWTLISLGRLKEALNAAQNSHKLALQIEDDRILWSSKNILASVYSHLGLHDSSLQYYLENIDTAIEMGNENYLATVYNNIGVAYWRLRNWEQSEYYYEKAKALSEKLGILKSIDYNNYGLSQTELGNFETAKAYFDQAQDLLEGEKTRRIEMLIKSNLGDLYFREKDYSRALLYLEESIAGSEKFDFLWLKTRSYRHLGRVLTKMGQTDRALTALKKSLSLARESGYKTEELESLYRLYETIRESGDDTAALNVFVSYSKLKDSLAAENRTNRADAHRIELQFAEKEKLIAELRVAQKAAEAEVLERKESQGRILRNLFILSSLTLVLILALLWSRYKTQLDAKLKTEEKNLALQHANHVKNRFLSMVGHELRTPINEIVGLVEMETKSTLPDSTLKNLKTISHSAYNLSQAIDDLIDINKIESSDFELHPTTFSLPSIIDSVVKLNRTEAEKKLLPIQNTISSFIPNQLIGDSLRLKQILHNLLHNAVKFTETGHVHITCELEDKNENSVTIQFSVADTGIGIDSQTMNQLFDRFTQEDSTLSRKHGGLGLGLSISQSLLEKMGGKIKVDSEKGKGSTFSFELTFPIVEKQNCPDEPESNLHNRPNYSLQVLVVEDGKVNQKIAKLETTRLGHRVDVVENGLQALEILSKTRYDIVLMDINMPVMDGIEATRRIRSNKISTLDPDVFICAFTASAIHGDGARFLNQGMNDFISKPVRPQKLLETFNNASKYQIERGVELNKKLTYPETPSSKFYNQIVVPFLSETPRQLDLIKTAISSKNIDKVSQLALSIAGSASYLKAGELEKTCISMESNAASKNYEQLEVLHTIAASQFYEIAESLSNPIKSNLDPL